MPRVLVIDDDNHVRASIHILLNELGFDVVTAENGRLGLRELAKSQFDVAIVDIYMPEMDGVKLIKAARERAPGMAVIAMSGVLHRGRSVLDTLSKAPDLSDITCIEKPFQPARLMQAIQSAMSARPAIAAAKSVEAPDGMHPDH
jgi:DNA-binding NtrC family response regulator